MITDISNPKLRDQVICVTGASGFIGRAVVAQLIGRGATVKALLRRPHGKSMLKALGAQPVIADLSRAAEVEAALKGADQIIHLAYDVRASGSDNLGVFDAVVAAAEAAQIQRFIHMSSIVVYDDWMQADLDETSSISTKDGGPYRQAKIAMEHRLEAATCATIALEPTLVYGPGSALWTQNIMNALRSGPVVLPKEQGVCNPVFVADVAQAVCCAAARNAQGFERYIVSGPPTRWHDFYASYQALTPGSSLSFEPLADLRARLGPRAPEGQDKASKPPLAARVSAQARRVMGNARFEGLVQSMGRLRPHSGPHYPDHKMLDLLTAKGICRTDAARGGLGFAPEYDLERGMAEIAKTQNA